MFIVHRGPRSHALMKEYRMDDKKTFRVELDLGQLPDSLRLTGNFVVRVMGTSRNYPYREVPAEGGRDAFNRESPKAVAEKAQRWGEKLSYIRVESIISTD